MSAQTHVETLESGLTLLTRELHVAPVAEIQIWACVGSADEQPGEAGLAHFHEHMLFKGTERRGVGEIAGAVEGVGGRINAFTSFDTTCYHATLPSAEIGVGIDVLADAVQHSTFDPEEVAREIEVVLEEIRRSEDEPHHVLSDAIFARAFRVHGYGAPILGTAESVASFTQEKLLAFYRKWYGPENLVVVATGDFDSGAVQEQVRAAFATAAPAAARRARPVEPPQDGLRTALLRRPFERACLDLSWTSVPMHHPDAACLDLLAFVLGEGDSSRLVLRVKEEAGLVDRIDASSYTPLDAGLFGATADLDADASLDAIEAVVREVELLRSEPVGHEELEKARANFLAGKAWEAESVSGVARRLGSFHVITGDALFEDAYLERIRQATAADLQGAAQRWLGPERLTVGEVLPEDSDAALDEAAVEAAVARGREAAARVFLPPRHDARGARELETYALASGIRLHVVRRPDVPVVALRGAMLGGLLAETEETSGITSFLAGAWLRGTRAHASADFARRIETLAADIDAFSGRNSLGVTLDCTKDHFEPVLELLGEMLVAPAFAPEEIERERADTLAAIARREDRLSARAFDLFGRMHYGAHPYALPIPGTAESVTRFDAAALREHHARLVRPDNLVLAVVGDVDPDQVAARVSRHLGALEGSRDSLALPGVAVPPPEMRSAVEHKDRAQAHLVIGFPGLTLDDPDRHALEVIAQILSGQGGRLFLELRDKQSLAYTVTATHVEGVAPGFFGVYIATAPEKFDDARAGILEELRRMLDEPPSAQELDRAHRYLVGSHAIDQQRASTRALHIALDALYGLGADHDRGYPDRVNAVTADDVQRVAKRIFDLSAYTTAAIRPE